MEQTKNNVNQHLISIGKSPKKKECIYSKVDNTKRIKLLKMVKEQGKTLKEASNILGINYSTAKTILRVYRIEKRILKKSSIFQCNEIVKKEEQHSPILSFTQSSTEENTLNYQLSYPQQNSMIYDQSAFMIQLQSLVSLAQNCVEQVITNEIILNNLKNKLNYLCERNNLHFFNWIKEQNEVNVNINNINEVNTIYQNQM